MVNKDYQYKQYRPKRSSCKNRTLTSFLCHFVSFVENSQLRDWLKLLIKLLRHFGEITFYVLGCFQPHLVDLGGWLHTQTVYL